jgi:hypothetical protein
VEGVAGPAEAALHFIGDQQRAGPPADVGNRVGELAGERADPAFAANRLGDDGGGAVADGGDERLRPGRIDERHRSDQRHERRPIVLVVRDRQRAHRSTGEGALDGDESRAAAHALGMPVAPRELQARFVGLGAAVAEERPRQPGERREPRRGLGLERVVIQVRRVQQRTRLVGDDRGQSRVRVTERGHADAGDEVQVLAAVDVVQT